MLKREIIKGESYVVDGHGLGRAVAVSEPRKDPYSERLYEVDIEYPDAPEDTLEYKRKRTISIRSVIKKWDEADEKKFQNTRTRVETERGWKQALTDAGYPPYLFRYDADTDDFLISFSGLIAEKVIMALTGEEIPPKEITNG